MKDKTVYVCSECGQESVKWVGRCPACGEWNTMKQLRLAAATGRSGGSGSAAGIRSVGTGRAAGSRPVRLADVSATDMPRLLTGDAELDRVLGGGIVPGSLVLLGGEPGIGKSTLLLQTVLRLARSHSILYVSGEESEQQIRLRADRLCPASSAEAAAQTGPSEALPVRRALPEGCLLLCDTRLELVLSCLEELRPALCVVDSIQTMQLEGVESTAGSVSQIRECATALLRVAKESGVPVVLVGHITKEGSLAGPKVLEHIVDTVLQFEGDRHFFYRLLRSQKNRFGSTSELGIYEMQSSGLRPVDNPSEMLLSQGGQDLSGVAIAAAVEGLRPFLIETQALVSTAAYGTPQRSATGFDLRRLNMLLAVLEKRVGFKLAQKDVFLNIAGGLRVSDPAIDLSVLSAVLSSNVDTPIGPGVCLCGEVGLSGELRPVGRIRERVAEAAKLGFQRIVVPAQSMKGLAGEPRRDIEVQPAARVEDALRLLFG